MEAGPEEKVQVASVIAHEMSGGTVFHKNKSAATVSKEFILLLKRFSLIQPMIPTDSMGAGRSGMGLKIFNSLAESESVDMFTFQGAGLLSSASS